MTTLFSFIGAGVVVGLVVGAVMGIIGDPPPWGAGAVAGALAAVAAWLLQQQAGRKL